MSADLKKRLDLGQLLLAGVLFGSLLWAIATGSCNGPEPDPSTRVGAVCSDGTRSSSTGNGACSGHGGVDEWIHEFDDCGDDCPTTDFEYAP